MATVAMPLLDLSYVERKRVFGQGYFNCRDTVVDARFPYLYLCSDCRDIIFFVVALSGFFKESHVQQLCPMGFDAFDPPLIRLAASFRSCYLR